MSEPTGPFKVILTQVDDSWNSRLRSEVSRLFQIDDETASNIVSAIPIVVLDGLDARAAGVVRERMRGLVEAGCRVVTTDDPADTIPRVNWPEMPEIARIPAEEPRQVITVHAEAGKAPPLSSFACPGCGQVFNISAAGRMAEPHQHRDQVGALDVPGASAPSGGVPGKQGGHKVHAHAHAGSGGTHSGANGTDKRAAATSAAEPGAKLAGDEWLDPPISAPKSIEPRSIEPRSIEPRRAEPKPAEIKPVESRPLESKPAATIKPVESKPVESKPSKPAGIKALENKSTTIHPVENKPAAAAAPVAPAAKQPSLLDDPLLAARRFDAAGSPEQGPAFSSTGEPTTLVARPITNRFARSAVVPQHQGAQPPVPAPPSRTPATAASGPATVAPLPNARPAGNTGAPGTGRFGAPPSVPQAPSPSGSGRFAAPPPAQPTPAQGKGTIPPTRGFGPAPVPPPSQFGPPPSDARGSAPLSPDASSSALDEELDVHFDEASDLQAVEKLDKPGKKKGASFDDDDDLTPSGMDDEDNLSSLLDDELDDPKAKKAAAAAKDASSKAKASKGSSHDSDEEDLLPFDELDSQGASTTAPKAKTHKSSGGDGSFDGGRIDDLLDGSSPATVAPGKKKSEPKPLLDSDDDEEELLLDDEEPKAKKGAPPKKPALDSSDDDEDLDDEALSDRTLFGASDDARPALKPAGKPEKDKPGAPAAKGKSKLPRESAFADALDMFEDEDEQPLDADPALSQSRSQAGDDDEIPEIKPLDLASDVQGIPPAKPAAKKKPESPFDRPSSSAILEPLDPNEAMAILKTHQNDDPLASADRPAPPKKGGGGGGAPLEPLDPNDALAILATPDERGKGGGGKSAPPPTTAPRKPTRQKNGRASEASKLVPLSASDEDFAFLEQGKGSKKTTDPFARAKKPGSGDKMPTAPSKKAAKLDSSDDSDSMPRPSKRPADSGKGPGGGGATKASPPPRKGGAVPEGAGECGLVLPRIATDSKRAKAAELISEIKSIGVDEAMKLTERTIIPVLTGVSRDVAEFHREKFERNKISARVTTRSAKEK